MFPVHTLSGKVVAFGGRVLSTENKKLAKYVNSPESEIYHKSNELYGIYFAKQAIVKQDRCFLVEGYTDVISMAPVGSRECGGLVRYFSYAGADPVDPPFHQQHHGAL